MKEIVITTIKLKKELLIFLGCFAAGFLTNVGAIIGYGRPWVELFSQIGYVVAVSVVLYVLLLFLRGLVALVRMFFHRHN